MKPERRQALARMQEVAVRLIFSDALLGRYLADPSAVLAEHGLSPGDGRLLPDVDSDDFRAEVRGRRLYIARDLAATFEKTAALLAGGKLRPDEWLDQAFFWRFLASDWFYEPRQGLPHPTGIGPGYELKSKFFGWVVEALALDAAGADVAVRAAAYHDFCLYLLAQRDHARDPWFRQLASGIRFAAEPGGDDEFVEVRLDRESDRLQTRFTDEPEPGLADLDAIVRDHCRHHRKERP